MSLFGAKDVGWLILAKLLDVCIPQGMGNMGMTLIV